VIVFLRVLFLGLFAAALGVTGWAGLHAPITPLPAATHPWFVVALFEAYAGFLTVFVWVAWKQSSWFARAGWFAAILLLGHIAVSAYCLAELFRTPRTASPATVLTSRRDGPGFLGLGLAIAGAIAVLLGIPGR
jgi:hypothetical protein